ncbi:MAG TPA: AI-2E family transporter, partial [Labilithrix sp.]|nr:AI-2E family transporter [Labilithrix sp.]
MAQTRKWALVAVLLLSFVAAAVVAAPLWIAIVFGCVMAISAHHPYRVLSSKLGQRSSLAAGIVTITFGLLAAVATTGILLALTNELMKLVAHLNQHGSSGSLAGLIGERSTRAIEELGVDTGRLYAWAQREVEAAASFAASMAAVVLRTTSEAFLGLIVALLTMYYVLLEGQGIARRIERMAPLEPRHTRALLVEAREVSRTAFIGTIATAMVQGLLAGIGYTTLGVPQPVTWALVTTLASFLPVIGTLIVWVPISGYLLMEGHPVRAIIMVAWGILVVTSLADYVIRPRIVGGRGHGHPLLTLIALLGGIEVFGLAGLIIAPIVMSVFVAAFRLYEREVRAGGVPGTTTGGGASSDVTAPASTGPRVPA